MATSFTSISSAGSLESHAAHWLRAGLDRKARMPHTSRILTRREIPRNRPSGEQGLGWGSMDESEFRWKKGAFRSLACLRQRFLHTGELLLQLGSQEQIAGHPHRIDPFGRYDKYFSHVQCFWRFLQVGLFRWMQEHR